MAAACAVIPFLTQDGQLTGIVDLGRAGVTHPAQDWALALRSIRDNFGPDGERGKKEKRVRREDDQNLGDCYAFVAIERHSKLVLNIALGKRENDERVKFLQVNSDTAAVVLGSTEFGDPADLKSVDFSFHDSLADYWISP